MKKATIQIEGLQADRLGRSFAGVSSFIIEVDQTSANALKFGPTGSAQLPVYVNSSREFDAGVDTVFDETLYDIVFDAASASNKAYIITFSSRDEPPKPGTQLPPGKEIKEVQKLLSEMTYHIEKILRRNK